MFAQGTKKYKGELDQEGIPCGIGKFRTRCGSWYYGTFYNGSPYGLGR